MSLRTILIVDDEAAIRDMVSTALELGGYRCLAAADALSAHQMILDAAPDLVLLDWMMPGISGIELARRLRRDSKTRALPIIFITAKGEEQNKVEGFETGADDYLTKPFSTKELLARIQAILRRTEPTASATNHQGLHLDREGHRIYADEQPLKLGPTEFRLLEFFMSHPERVFSREQLLDAVWGNAVYIDDRTVDVHIRRLRKTLARYGYDPYVQTVRGSGYRFSSTQA